MGNDEILMKAENLQKHFPVYDFFGRLKYSVKAVDGINLEIRKGETFGLVGESGCGKSTLGRTLIRMYEPTGGKIIFQGQDITDLKGKELLTFHKRMQIIFQDPYTALNPNQNVREIISEPVRLHLKMSEDELYDYVYGTAYFRQNRCYVSWYSRGDCGK